MARPLPSGSPLTLPPSEPILGDCSVKAEPGELVAAGVVEDVGTSPTRSADTSTPQLGNTSALKLVVGREVEVEGRNGFSNQANSKAIWTLFLRASNSEFAEDAWNGIKSDVVSDTWPTKLAVEGRVDEDGVDDEVANVPKT